MYDYIRLLFQVADADASFQAAVAEMTDHSLWSVSAESDYDWSITSPTSTSGPWVGRTVELGTFDGVIHLGKVPSKGVVLWQGFGSELATNMSELRRVGANLRSGVEALYEVIGATSAVGFGDMEVQDIWDILTGVRAATDQEKEEYLLFAMGSTALVSYITTNGTSWNGPASGGGANGASYYFG